MNEAKIFIVEDEPILVEQLRIMLEELGYWIVGTADTGEKAISRILDVQPDIVLMDININGELSGIDVGMRLKPLGFNGGILFLTSLDDDAVFDEARNVFPFDYLIKPVRQRKLKRSLELFLSKKEQDKSPQGNTVVLKGSNELHKISVADIMVIEVQDKLCLITMRERKESIGIRIGLSELLEFLNRESLIKVHRSYVVNEHHIDSYDITMSQLILGSISIPVSRTYKGDLLKRLK